MLQTTIPSYLYQQYADDDNLQAFVKAYNDATQYYLDWFVNIGLPFYPGLAGSLLDWVCEGVYGQSRTSIAFESSGALGTLNSVPFNVDVLNFFSPPVETTYQLGDDAFQRLLTWNFYKGDGKRFCVRWLKRRIMRFLVGTNGLDPQPTQSGFVVGAENTTAISVRYSTNTVIVSISQSAISNLVQLAPGILTLFQAAFQSGVLDLPAQFNYVCNITS